MEILFQLLLKGCTIEAISENGFGKSTELFQLLLKGCTIEAYFLLYTLSPPTSFQFLLKGCTIEATKHRSMSGMTNCFSCCWKDVRLKLRLNRHRYLLEVVSVVVERMYDWSKATSFLYVLARKFQLLLKGCTIEASWERSKTERWIVSVVVERMYDWSSLLRLWPLPETQFQLLLKGCTIEAFQSETLNCVSRFQLLLKGCTIEAVLRGFLFGQIKVSVVVERMYDWSLNGGKQLANGSLVSVVVERMYDWSYSIYDYTYSI